MPIYVLHAHERTPFHEIKELCSRLEFAGGDRSEEERLKAAIHEAMHRLETWMQGQQEDRPSYTVPG